MYIYDNIFFLEREMFQTQFVENLKTRFIFKNLFSKNRSVYEICGKIL